MLLFFDASEPIGKVDKQLAETITEEAKPVVFVVNKWDLYAGDVKKREWTQYLRDTFRDDALGAGGLRDGHPGAATSRRRSTRPSGSIGRATRGSRPPGSTTCSGRRSMPTGPRSDGRGRPVRLYYATQVEVGPPTIVISASAPKSVTEPYKRYLAGVFQQAACPFARCRSGCSSAARRPTGDRSG